MSHIECPYCGSRDHVSGFGLAAGPMGSYTFCNSCDELIEFSADTEGLDDEHVKRLRDMQDALYKRLDEARSKRTGDTDAD